MPENERRGCRREGPGPSSTIWPLTAAMAARELAPDKARRSLPKGCRPTRPAALAAAASSITCVARRRAAPANNGVCKPRSTRRRPLLNVTSGEPSAGVRGGQENKTKEKKIMQSESLALHEAPTCAADAVTGRSGCSMNGLCHCLSSCSAPDLVGLHKLEGSLGGRPLIPCSAVSSSLSHRAKCQRSKGRDYCLP